MSEKIVPKLRFNGFNDEWKEFKLNEISKRITRKNKNLETDRPLTISAQHGLVDQIEYFNKIVASKSLINYYLLNNGEFAYNKSYSKGYPFGAVKRLDDYENGAISTLYICFEVNDKINSNLLKEYFETDKWHKEIYKIAVEGARNHGLLNIAVGDFFNTKHTLPKNQKEQEKLANFLVTINRKISLLENKHQAYINFKKYLMQQIFAQKLRFDFNDDWQDHTFKELLIEVNEKTTVNNQHEILSSTKEGIFTQKEYFADRNVASKDNTGYKILRKNQIVLSPQNLWMGNINVNTEFEIGIVSPSYKIYETTDLIEINYFKHIIKLPRLIYEYKCASEQGASIVRRNLNKQLFNEITISIPSLKEQQKIGNMLTIIDKKITETSKQIDESKEFKKGLLQQMFV